MSDEDSDSVLGWHHLSQSPGVSERPQILVFYHLFKFNSMVNRLNLGCIPHKLPLPWAPCSSHETCIRSVVMACGECLGLLKVTECPEQVCAVQLEMLVRSSGSVLVPRFD